MPHPYSTSIAGLVSAIRQLRSTFPASIGADTLKKWSIASNNESQVIVVLRFLKLIDEEGKKVPENSKAFVEHDDAEFAKKFESVVRAAYAELFDTWGDGAWNLDKNKLIGFFRNADNTTARVGQEQTNTFLALAGLAGHGAAPSSAAPAAAKGARAKRSPAKQANAKSATTQPPAPALATPPQAGGLTPAVTLRVEINLPLTSDQSVYDSIFKSIKENLLNA